MNQGPLRTISDGWRALRIRIVPAAPGAAPAARRRKAAASRQPGAGHPDRAGRTRRRDDTQGRTDRARLARHDRRGGRLAGPCRGTAQGARRRPRRQALHRQHTGPRLQLRRAGDPRARTKGDSLARTGAGERQPARVADRDRRPRRDRRGSGRAAGPTPLADHRGTGRDRQDHGRHRDRRNRQRGSCRRGVVCRARFRCRAGTCGECVGRGVRDYLADRQPGVRIGRLAARQARPGRARQLRARHQRGCSDRRGPPQSRAASVPAGHQPRAAARRRRGAAPAHLLGDTARGRRSHGRGGAALFRHPAVHGTRDGDRRWVRLDRRRCPGGPGDLPPARRGAAGARTCGRAGRGLWPRRSGRAARRSLRAVEQRPAHGLATSTDAAATMDWNFTLLPHLQQVILRRLAVFRGDFTMDAAASVAGDAAIAAGEVIDAVAELAAKSLLATDISGNVAYHRLLETTRVYALARLTERGELQEFSRRHAEYYRGLLERIEEEWERKPAHLADVNNVRAALEWCFSVNGDLEIGVRLAVTASPVFLLLSMVPECYRWSERAILALDDATGDGSEEMHLQASLGISSMQMHGQSDIARVALNRSLAIAEARGDALNQVGLLGVLSMFHTREADFKTALHYAKNSRSVAGTVNDPAGIALAHSILGRSLHFMGDHSGARVELEASFHHPSRSPRTGETYLGLDRHILDGLGLARTLWLQGYPAMAVERARQTIRDAEHRNHPASLAVALSWFRVFSFGSAISGAPKST